MRIAIALTDGILSPHLGRCERFALVDVDSQMRRVIEAQDLEAPPHEPGLLPRWLAERGASVIIAGGIGPKARDLFSQNGIEVIAGASARSPQELVAAFLDGALQVGDNRCDHPDG